MKKRYPRGKVFSNSGWSGMAENIELRTHGVFYSMVGSDTTEFAPYTSIDRIKYESIPQEVRDEHEAIERARAARAKEESMLVGDQPYERG